MALFSLGHSNHPIERLVELLREHAIETLVDVRSVPYSRWNPQFNRAALKASLRDAGIEYLWRGDTLGGREPISLLDPHFAASMREVLELARDRAVALMCSERDPARCHRTTKLAAWLHRLGDGAHLTHISPLPDGRCELVDSRELQARLKPSLLWHELRR